jgi:hypothetical protein
MTINRNCEYYNSRTIKRNVTSNTLSPSPPIIVHECHHKKNTDSGGNIVLTSKSCNIENEYCPYNSLRKN